jgi:hypothetical protein
VASLAELERDWSLDDGALAHELLDELDRAEAESRRQQQRKD